MHKRDITPAVAARLIAEQFPEWAALPVVPVELNGWDNTTFRLGDHLSIRMPSADGYVPQIEKEHQWLPRLAPQLPRRIPEPVARGEANDEFPRPWSVYRWIEGEPAGTDRVVDTNAFAADLAAFLSALYAIDASDGPAFGRHSFARGGPVTVWDEQTRECIELLAGKIDAANALAVWEEAVASECDRAPVWVHGDITGSNLLVADGALHAVIDFGCSAVGDPACDLVMAWTFFDSASRDIFCDGLALDDATWARARGWALWKALITIVRAAQDGEGADVAAARFCWRGGAHETVERILA